jgi:hypothetical protein
MSSQSVESPWSGLKGWSTRFAATGAVVALLALYPASSLAQMPQAVQQAAGALNSDQQSLANNALCSALGSQVANPAAATPSDLSSSGVISAAASTFAGTTKLPLPSATTMLQGYVAQHATDILASCAASNAASGLTSKIPAGMPSMPKVAY